MSLLQKYYFCITISKDNNMFVFPVCHHFQPWLILPMIALYIDANDLLKLHSNIYISTISQDILKLSILRYIRSLEKRSREFAGDLRGGGLRTRVNFGVDFCSTINSSFFLTLLNFN